MSDQSESAGDEGTPPLSGSDREAANGSASEEPNGHKDLVGRTLPRYKILRRIGKGGMGVVYEATQLSLGRKVALKVLRSGLAERPGFLRRFHREAKSAAALTHPSIAQIYEVGEIDGLPFFSMELVNGCSLSTYIFNEGPMDVNATVRIICQVAAGLENARRTGIVHRDIKPSNIMIKKSGRAKIIDLGLAKPWQQADSVTRTGIVLGTLYYMAPEQSQSPSKVDTRADIYSLGITWYYALTGEPPFDGETPLQVMKKHCTEPLPSLKQHREDVPDAVEAIIRKMTRKRPKDRFQTPRDVLEAAKKYRSGQTTKKSIQSESDRSEVPTLDSLPAPERKSSTSVLKGLKRNWMALAAIAGLLIVGGLTVLVGFTDSSAPIKPKGPSSVSESSQGGGTDGAGTPPPASDSLGEGASDSAAPSGSGDTATPIGEKADIPSPQERFESIQQKIKSLTENGKLVAAVNELSELPPELNKKQRNSLVKRRKELYKRCEQRLQEALTRAEDLAEQGKTADAVQAAQEASDFDVSGGTDLNGRIEEIRARARKIKEQAQALKSLRKGWRTQVTPHLARRDYEAARLAFRKIADQMESEKSRKLVAGFRAQLDLLRGIEQRIAKYADSLKSGTDITVGSVEGDFISYEDETFTIESGGTRVEQPIDRLSLQNYLKLVEKALRGNEAKLHTAAALLHFYRRSPDVNGSRRRLERARGIPDKPENIRNVIIHLEDALDRTAGERNAEALYTAAAGALRKKRLDRCSAYLEELTNKYPDSDVVQDAARCPTVEKMQTITQNPGQLITVSESSSADFESLRKAVKSVKEPNSLIDVRDRGTYPGPIDATGKNKKGLILQSSFSGEVIIDGKNTEGFCVDLPENSVIAGFQITKAKGGIRSKNGAVARCLIRPDISKPFGKDTRMVTRSIFPGNAANIRSVIGSVAFGPIEMENDGQLRDSVVLGPVTGGPSADIDNCLITDDVNIERGAIDSSTILGDLIVKDEGQLNLSNSIVRQVRYVNWQKKAERELNISYCNIIRMRKDYIQRRANSSISVNPGFINPSTLSFFLGPDSLCRGRASDGGNIGIRATPALTGALNLARKYRQEYTQ